MGLGMLNAVFTGDDELLASDDTHHVVFQGRELQRRREAAKELYGRVLGGKMESTLGLLISSVARY